MKYFSITNKDGFSIITKNIPKMLDHVYCIAGQSGIQKIGVTPNEVCAQIADKGGFILQLREGVTKTNNGYEYAGVSYSFFDTNSLCTRYSSHGFSRNYDVFIGPTFIGAVNSTSDVIRVFVDPATPVDSPFLDIGLVSPRERYASQLNSLLGVPSDQFEYIGDYFAQTLELDTISGLKADTYCFDGINLIAAFDLKENRCPWVSYPSNIQAAKAVRKMLSGEEPLQFVFTTNEMEGGIYFSDIMKRNARRLRAAIKKGFIKDNNQLDVDAFSTTFDIFTKPVSKKYSSKCQLRLVYPKASDVPTTSPINGFLYAENAEVKLASDIRNVLEGVDTCHYDGVCATTAINDVLDEAILEYYTAKNEQQYAISLNFHNDLCLFVTSLQVKTPDFISQAENEIIEKFGYDSGSHIFDMNVVYPDVAMPNKAYPLDALNLNAHRFGAIVSVEEDRWITQDAVGEALLKEQIGTATVAARENLTKIDNFISELLAQPLTIANAVRKEKHDCYYSLWGQWVMRGEWNCYKLAPEVDENGDIKTTYGNVVKVTSKKLEYFAKNVNRLTLSLTVTPASANHHRITEDEIDGLTEKIVTGFNEAFAKQVGLFSNVSSTMVKKYRPDALESGWGLSSYNVGNFPVTISHPRMNSTYNMPLTYEYVVTIDVSMQNLIQLNLDFTKDGVAQQLLAIAERQGTKAGLSALMKVLEKNSKILESGFNMIPFIYDGTLYHTVGTANAFYDATFLTSDAFDEVEASMRTAAASDPDLKVALDFIVSVRNKMKLASNGDCVTYFDAGDLLNCKAISNFNVAPLYLTFCGE